MQFAILIASLAIGAIATPAPPMTTQAPSARAVEKRLTIPKSAGSTALAAVSTILAGKTFDGGMVMYDRGKSCTGQAEGGDKDAVFIVQKGATLKNVIIGPNQIEGVHCLGACTIENVWWTNVCEDALTVKNQAASETTNVKGGGAQGADDKVIQHNGGGTVAVSDFAVEDFGKLYRSCGNCGTQVARHLKVTGGSATSGDLLAGINSNYGDSATISGVSQSGIAQVCQTFTGNNNGAEPPKNKDNGSGCDGKFCVC